MAIRHLLCELVEETKYVYNPRGQFLRAHISANPLSGTLLVEMTSAPVDLVKLVEEGGTDNNVLWEAWDEGEVNELAHAVLDAPWTALRITATDAHVTVTAD